MEILLKQIQHFYNNQKINFKIKDKKKFQYQVFQDHRVQENLLFQIKFLDVIFGQGIYLNILKIQYKEYFNNLFDYILILDSEGLQNPNQVDPEFDKKIALFILAISDIILINVKGDINDSFKNLVEMCIFTLITMKSNISSIKQLSWCFNQNNDEQIQGIANNLNLEYKHVEGDDNNQTIDYNEFLNISKENIQILGFASIEKLWRNKDNLGNFNDWRQLIINETYSEEAYMYGIRMIKNFINKFNSQTETSQMCSLSLFLQNINTNWQTICNLPDLLEFTELISYKKDQLMKSLFEQIYEEQDFKFKDEIGNELEEKVNKSSTINLSLLEKIYNDEKENLKLKFIQIEESLKEKLLEFKQLNQIPKKIFLKYLKQLSERLNTTKLESEVIVFEEIKNKEREYQNQRGFKSLDNFILEISKNEQKLKQFQGQEILIRDQFEKLWQQITNDSENKQIKILKEYSEKQYQAISSFTEYKLLTKNEFDYINYFTEHINGETPFRKEKEEKFNIFNKFQQELQIQDQFRIIINAKETMRYVEIFQQKLENRIRKDKTKYNVIKINNYYLFQITIYFVEKEKLINYIKGQNIIKDLDLILQKFQQKQQQQQNNQKGTSKYNCINNQICQGNNYSMQLIIPLNGKCYGQTIMIKQQTHLRNFKPVLTITLIKQKKQLIRHKIIFLKVSKSSTKICQQKTSKKQLIIPKTQNQKFYAYLEYIQSKNNSHYASFQLDFINIFKQEMFAVDEEMLQNKNQQKISELDKINSWQKIYFSIYDLIKSEMTKNNCKENENKDNSDNEDISSSNTSLIKIIMSKIEQEIIEYNKGFANFGIILNGIGERCIYYYSMLIIWRFTCYKKWKGIQQSKKKFEEVKQNQLLKFIADIKKNKTEQSKLKAQNLINNVYKDFIQKFYKENELAVGQAIKDKNMACVDLIKILDKNILKDYKKEQDSKQYTDIQIYEYITKQREFIEKYAQNQVQKIQAEVNQTFEIDLREKLKTFLGQILKNVAILVSHTALQDPPVKSIDYFDISKDDKNQDVFYEILLFKLILQCLQGKQEKKGVQNQNELEQDQNVNIIEEYKEIFQVSNYKAINIPILNISLFQDSEQQIQLLKPFADELQNQLQIHISQIDKKVKLDLSKFQSYSELDTIRLNMTGCLHSCPMCKRKCDQSNSSGHKHKCSNGHQLRGMNGILIENTPSLFTCDEMNDESLITTLETQVTKQWKEIRRTYDDWIFIGIGETELEENKIKMMKVWNEGTGQMVCQQLRQILNNPLICFVPKNNYQEVVRHPKIHYVFIIDDSGSMLGKRWIKAKKSCLYCMKEISKNSNARVSVIIFNYQARIIVDCEIVDIDQCEQKIDYDSGETNFCGTFQKAYDLIIKHQNYAFEKTEILFYTDGAGEYPKQEIQQFTMFPEQQRARIFLNCCTEDKNPITLQMIVNEFNSSLIKSELKSNFLVADLEKAWTEIVSRDYHKLKS
ncbi:unnamed protein product [Paramecium sonneborni]|uniref:VWFA domain-containing protein n=1 Tax=Paramecium sonneborni TaxID=65129 RepID=A0A8S1NCX3_9CILI|nr:unnamed protein product [Paramecium sonneborni]